MTSEKKPRKKSRRVRMAEAVRKEATATLLALGFRNPRKANPLRWEGGRLNAFLRWRGSDFDEIRFEWDKNNGAMFRVNFNCSRVAAPEADGAGAKVVVWIGSVRGGIFGWFGPWRSINGAVRLLRKRLRTLDAYFRDGRVRRNIYPHRPDVWALCDWKPTMHEDEPWLDPEFRPAPHVAGSVKPAP